MAEDTSSMKGVVFAGVDAVAVSDSVPMPRVEEPTDAVCRVIAAGLCGSDLHPFHGREAGLDVGCVMGHEMVGEVVEVGAAVKSIKVGQQVFAPFSTCCFGAVPPEGSSDESCSFCPHLPCRCPRGQLFGWRSAGVGLHGCQAEYVRVPLADGTLVERPPSVTLEESLLLGDVLSTAFFCAENAGIGNLDHLAAKYVDGATAPASAAPLVSSAGPHRTFVVVGCGPVGLLTVVAALELGQPGDILFAVDRVPERLAAAESLGARPLNFEDDDVVGIVRAASASKHGADASLEVVGAPSATRLAYDVLGPGGRLSSIGVHTEEHLAVSPGELYDKNCTYSSGRCPARLILSKILPVVSSGRWRTALASVVSHRLALDDAVKAYKMFDEKLDGCTKVILYPSGVPDDTKSAETPTSGV